MNRIIARLNRKAYDLTEEEKFIQECKESGKFDEDQTWEIKAGFEDGLTMEQVKLYADTKFDGDQMYEIREGFENGLTMEQVKFYANPNFDEDQMLQIRWGFEDEMTIEEVKEKFNL